MCLINCTLRKSSILQGTYFILVESMPSKYRKAFVSNFNHIVWMNSFCHSICCMLHIQYVQLNRLCCETHGIVIIRATK